MSNSNHQSRHGSWRRSGLALLLCLMACAAYSCNLFNDISYRNLINNIKQLNITYKGSINDTRMAIPAVQEFVTLYPNYKIFFSYFTGEMGPTTLNIKTALYGRYILSMSIPVYLDQTHTRVEGHDPPTILLRECRAVTLQPQGEVRYESQNQREFGPDDWKKIVKAEWDLRAVGVEMIEDRPVLNFDEAWRTWENGVP